LIIGKIPKESSKAVFRLPLSAPERVSFCDSIMISFEQARQIVLDSVCPVESVRTPILEALGLVAAEEVTAGERIPPFDNSAMDGYAVRAESKC